MKQLENFSKKVYLPFGYLFLSEPPKEKLCDKIAAEFPVPEKEFIFLWKNHPDMKLLSRHFKVS